VHFRGSFDLDEIDVVRHIQSGGAGDEKHRVALMDEGSSQRVAHFPRGAVRQETDGINRLASGAGGDEDFHAGESDSPAGTGKSKPRRLSDQGKKSPPPA